MLSRMVVRVCLCLFAFVVPSVMWSQATTSLGGVVADPSGAVVPAATVTLTSPATGASRSVTTNRSGEYAFAQLVPGRYELLVVATGFSKAKKDAFELFVSQPATINVVLKVATSAAEVTVTAGSEPVLNTTDATLGNSFAGKQILELPIEGRNVPDLLSLQPGVTFLGRTDSNTGTTSVGNTANDSRSGATNGGRSDQSNIT